MRPLALALFALLATAPAASASLATVVTTSNPGKGCTADPNVCQQSQFFYNADPGEANDVQVSYAGSSLLVRDTGADIRPGDGCQRQGQNMVRCSAHEGPGLGFVRMAILLLDQADRFQNGTNLASGVGAGEGDDRIVGGTLPDTLEGGPGRDRLEGAGGPDFLTDDGGVEPDVFDGGDGDDTVSYASRRAAVVVDLRSPTNPSGEQGENDSLTAIERGQGGRGADTLYGGGAGPVELSGRAGNDKLFGTFGPDRLYGEGGHDKIHGFGGSDRLVGGKGNDGLNAGCGRAKLFGQAGRDRLYSANGAADRVDGGADRDFARIDQADTEKRVERVDLKRIDGCALATP